MTSSSPDSEGGDVTHDAIHDGIVQYADWVTTAAGCLQFGGEAQFPLELETDFDHAVDRREHGTLLERHEPVAQGAVAGTPARVDARWEGHRIGNDRLAANCILADRSVDAFFRVLWTTKR